MMHPDLSVLAETDKAFEKALAELQKKYKSPWDDDVHESFRPLLINLEKRQLSFHAASQKADEIYNSSLSLHVEDLCRAADQLCTEADSL